MRFDLVIRGGDVYDGTGADPVRADVGVSGERIVAVSSRGLGPGAATELDASGLAVCPGFIDTHTHSDLAAFLPDEHADVAAAAVRQGVTTEVCGNCGFSPFPAPPGREAAISRHIGVLGGTVEWTDLAGFAEAVRQRGLFANLAPLVGHGTLRAAVLGFDDRLPRPEELRQMRRLAEEALEQGAFGVSSGLIYSPAVYAETGELIEIAGAAARLGRPYTTHIRGETDMVADSVSEALEIGRRSGAPVHVSHHKAAGRENWGRTAETLDMIRRERERGQDVTVDVYPYTAGSTLLFALLPPWTQDGGIGAMLERLGDRHVRERIAADLAAPSRSWENMVRAAGWDAIQISTCPGRPEVEGSFVHELADGAGKEPLDYVCDLLIEQHARPTMILHMMDERDVRRVIGFDASMIGSDGIPLPGKPHPRWAGTFARVLGRYAGPAGPLTLPRAIRKMTLDSANRFKLDDRGVVRAGAAADLVVFDPGKVLDRATYADPLLAPAGIRYVLVNGRTAVHDGSFLGQRHGRVLSPR